jgi:hypothetical protein
MAQDGWIKLRYDLVGHSNVSVLAATCEVKENEALGALARYWIAVARLPDYDPATDTAFFAKGVTEKAIDGIAGLSGFAHCIRSLSVKGRPWLEFHEARGQFCVGEVDKWINSEVARRLEAAKDSERKRIAKARPADFHRNSDGIPPDVQRMSSGIPVDNSTLLYSLSSLSGSSAFQQIDGLLCRIAPSTVGNKFQRPARVNNDIGEFLAAFEKTVPGFAEWLPKAIAHVDALKPSKWGQGMGLLRHLAGQKLDQGLDPGEDRPLNNVPVRVTNAKCDDAAVDAAVAEAFKEKPRRAAY